MAEDITRREKNISSISPEQKGFKDKAEAFESQVTDASNKFQKYFQKNSGFVMAGTFLEIAIAINAMSTLLKNRAFWISSLFISGVGIYYLAIALL